MGAKIFNSNLTKEIIDGAKLQQNLGGIPSELAEKVIPVMEVNPKLLRITNLIAQNAAINSTNQIIHTTSTTKDTYITGYQLSFIKDAGSTATIIRGYFTPEGGVATPFVRICCLTTVAQTGETSLTFKEPVKLSKGTNITINPDTNVGNLSASLTVYGYTLDNINA